MELPQPGPEHARLGRFAGTWSGEENLEPSPWGPGGTAQGRGVYQMVTDGMALVQDYAETRGGAVAFRGHGVFTIDPQSREVLWWWFDSMGFPPDGPARGTWVDETLTLTRNTPRGDSRYVFVWHGDSYEFSIENRFPGQSDFALFMRALYRREA